MSEDDRGPEKGTGLRMRVLGFARWLDRAGAGLEGRGSKLTEITRGEVYRALAVWAGVGMAAMTSLYVSKGPELSPEALLGGFPDFTGMGQIGPYRGTDWRVEPLVRRIMDGWVKGMRVVPGVIDPDGGRGVASVVEVVRFTPAQEKVVREGLEQISSLRFAGTFLALAVVSGLVELFELTKARYRLGEKVPVSTTMEWLGQGMQTLAGRVRSASDGARER